MNNMQVLLKKYFVLRSCAVYNTQMIKKLDHPGMAIKALIEKSGLNITQAAKKLGIIRNHLSLILNGKMGISAEMAIKFEKLFKKPALTFLKLQMLYEYQIALEKHKAE